MTRYGYGPAAGTHQGAAPLPAAIHLPEFLRFSRDELQALCHVLRDPLAWHLYGLLRVQADFTSGHVLTTYARLMELMTPPRPQNGPRRRGPTYEQLRRVMRDLEGLTLVRRHPADNAAQGQLRLWLPYVEAANREREQSRVRRLSTQGSTQGQKARKAA